MILSNGCIFRWGQRIKDFGERMACIKVFGIHLLRPFCGPVIGLGYAIRELVMDSPIGER